jgi:hypothetical protein
VKVARELEGIGTRLAEKAANLDELFNAASPLH